MSAIHILVHGLIALVPATDSDGMANHMTALLVDARNKPPEFTECFAPHQPAIKLHVAESAECQAAECDSDGEGDCICSLIRKEVHLQAQLLPEKANEKKKFERQPARALPFNDAEARAFSYVANLSILHFELDKRYLEPIPPPALVARMEFPFESVSACSLATRHDEGSKNVHPMSFRALHTLEQSGETSQALAQMVAFAFTTDQDSVTVTLTEFGGGKPQTLSLEPVNGAYQIELWNERFEKGKEHDLPPDSPCDDGVGRDFAFFYNLTNNPPAWKDRPIPHLKHTRWKSVKDLEIKECRANIDHLPNSHPICAMASFAQ